MCTLNRVSRPVTLAVVLALSVAAGGRAQFGPPDGSECPSSSGGIPLLDNCKVSFISEPVLAFQEPGLVRLVPEEGQQINRGDVLSQLDDQDVKLRVDVARYDYEAARLQVENDIQVRYAVAQSAVKKADLESGRDANRRRSGVVTDMEMRKRKLDYDASQLQIENSQHEMQVLSAQAKVKQAELRSAEAMLNHMQLRSPITGIVTKKLRYVGEYARAGDPIVQVGQLDRLRVEGRISSNDLPITEARGRDVEIRVGAETFRSRIEYVDARVDMDRYIVWAEIENRRGPRNEFIVRPGMIAEMQILVEPSVARSPP